MSNFSEDDIRHAAEMREWVMKQISEKQDQVDKLNTILSLIDNLLKQSSFKPASSFSSSSTSSPSSRSVEFISQTSPQVIADTAQNQSNRISRNISPTTIATTDASPKSQKEQQPYSDDEGGYNREVKPLKRLKDDFLMANAEISQNTVEIIPAKGTALNINTPPFRSFFLNRILEGMKSKDAEKVSQNQIDDSTSLNYYVEDDESGMIKKIIINNYRDKERLNEIFNTSTWVFTRMIEKSNRA